MYVYHCPSRARVYTWRIEMFCYRFGVNPSFNSVAEFWKVNPLNCYGTEGSLIVLRSKLFDQVHAFPISIGIPNAGKQINTASKISFFAKLTILWPKTLSFQSGQSSLTPPILIHWWWTMGRWNPNIKENLFQVFNRKQGQFQQIIICPPQTNSTHDNKCAKYFQEFFVTYIFKHLSTYLPWLVFLNNQKKFKIWLVRQCVQDLKDVLVFWINCFLKYNNMNTPDVGYPGITNFLVECRRWYNRAKDIRH